jgi:phosphatidylglycerophosphate synthase
VLEGSSTLAPGTRLGGLTPDRRIVLAATRAGFHSVKSASRAGASYAGPQRLLVLPGNVLPQAAWLRALLVRPMEPETLHVDAPAAAMIDTADPARVLDAARECRDIAALARALAPDVPIASLAPDPEGRFVVRGRDDVRAAERWLLRGLIKRTEGFMSRHFERKVSTAITRRLVDTPVTPNAMTLVSVAIGLAAAPFFLAAAPALQTTGALLFLLHSIVDGCDGELARLRFQESRGGALLDFWGDNVVHVAVFGCMALGWSLASHSAWPLLAGAAAIAGTLGAAATVARRFVSERSVGAAGSIATRLTDTLANRDFIYAVIILALFGHAAWFVVIAGLGTPAFVLVLVLGGAARRSR